MSVAGSTTTCLHTPLTHCNHCASTPGCMGGKCRLRGQQGNDGAMRSSGCARTGRPAGRCMRCWQARLYSSSAWKLPSSSEGRWLCVAAALGSAAFPHCVHNRLPAVLQVSAGCDDVERVILLTLQDMIPLTKLFICWYQQENAANPSMVHSGL